MEGTTDMGIATAETVGQPANPSLTPDEKKARHDALRGEVHRIKEQAGRTLTELSREIGVAYGTFSGWAAGTYAGRVDRIDDQVERWLRGLDGAKRAAAALREAPGFVQTPASERFIAAFEHAQHAPDLVVVSGAAGIGKTTAVGAYRAQSSNVWVVTGEPCITTPRMILDEIAELLGLSEGRSTHRISRNIVARMRNTRGVLIVDEAQHLNTGTLDQLRTLHDLAGVGVVFVGNESVHVRIEGGARRPDFAQLFSRVGMRVQRAKPVRGDIDALLDAWEIVGGQERRMLSAIARKPGALRVMTKVMRIADMQARSAGEAIAARYIEMAWEHLAAQQLDLAT